MTEFLNVDYEALVSEADIVYNSPANGTDGHPIGNGRMGTMVWTSSSTINFQINRNDVFAVNRDHIGPQERRAGGRLGDHCVDCCCACARITIDLGGNVFSGAFSQHLSLYWAEETISGEAVSLRCFVSSTRDVLVVEIDDSRPNPQPVRLTLSMWRPPVVQTGNHTARYDFDESLTDKALVVQQFDEYFPPEYGKSKNYHCRSAVAAQIVAPRVRVFSSGVESCVVEAPAQRGRRMILVSSAASFSNQGEVGAHALALLDAVSARSYEDLRAEHIMWWEDFWSRTFVKLTSKDGTAELMQQVRTIFLYNMASSSRGELPPKWNGSIFSVAGDTRDWGAQFWVWTTESLYWPLYAADATDLSNAFFNMYVNHVPLAEKAAAQRWGVPGGAFFPETVAFDGPAILPADVAAEWRDVFCGKKAKFQVSSLTRSLCQYCSHLQLLLNQNIEYGRYYHISHIVSSASELAVHAWWRYRYTGDREWLCSHAYPLLRGAAEFYRHLAKLGDDGYFHLSGTNVHEDFWGVRDSLMDMAAIRGTLPLAIRAAEILGVDDGIRSRWQFLLENVAPYPMGSDPAAIGYLADDVWAAGITGEVEGPHSHEDVWHNPIFPFEDWTLETDNPSMDYIARKVVEISPRLASSLNGEALNTAIRTPIAVVRAGRGQELPTVLRGYYDAFSPMKNGMSMFEGENAQSIEHLGILTMTIQEGLVQAVSPRPGEPEVIRVFPAWPDEWDATFRLLARGGFLVTSSIRNGEVEFVEVESRLGERCRLRNPWGDTCVVTEAGGSAHELKGSVISFDTRKGSSYMVVPKGFTKAAPRRIPPEPVTEPASYTFRLPNGRTVDDTLGIRRKGL